MSEKQNMRRNTTEKKKHHKNMNKKQACTLGPIQSRVTGTSSLFPITVQIICNSSCITAILCLLAFFFFLNRKELMIVLTYCFIVALLYCIVVLLY